MQISLERGYWLAREVLRGLVGVRSGASPDDETERLSPATLPGLILNAFIQYVRAETSERPLVPVWEDLHGVDPSSLKLIEGLLPLTEEVPPTVCILH